MKWAIVGDAQAPFHDPAAIELASQVIKRFKPDHLVYNGDMTDFWSISRHNSKRHEILASVSLQEEVDISIEVQNKLASGLPRGATCHMIDGNHEQRLEAFLGTGPQSVLASLKGLMSHELFQYEKRGFASYHPYGEGIWITGNLYCYHGEYVGTLPGDSVKKEIVAIGSSVIMNHVHRRADLRFRQGMHEHRGIENGCLCQLKAGYKPMTNWAQCLTLVTVKDSRHWTAEVIDIIHEDDIVYCVFRGEYIEVPSDMHDGMALSWIAHKNLQWKDF